jgi:hypothetical protein
MQGKTAWVLNTTVDKINNCLRSNPLSYCLNTYKACNCTIDSTGSCSCNFNAPSNPGTYNYTGFVDLNSNNYFDSNEYDTKTLKVMSCYKTCNTDNDCKGDFEKNCCKNGLAAYCRSRN